MPAGFELVTSRAKQVFAEKNIKLSFFVKDMVRYEKHFHFEEYRLSLDSNQSEISVKKQLSSLMYVRKLCITTIRRLKSGQAEDTMSVMVRIVFLIYLIRIALESLLTNRHSFIKGRLQHSNIQTILSQYPISLISFRKKFRFLIIFTIEIFVSVCRPLCCFLSFSLVICFELASAVKENHRCKILSKEETRFKQEEKEN